MRISDWSSDVCSSDLAAVAGLGLARVLLGLVAQLRDVRPAEHGVVVEGHLGVERDHLAVLGDDQRVDRKSVLEGKRVSVRVKISGRRIMNKQTNKTTKQKSNDDI